MGKLGGILRGWGRWPVGVVATLVVALACTANLPRATSPSDNEGYLFGIIGNDGTHLREERAAGVEAKLLELSWRNYYPEEGEKDQAYVDEKKAEVEELRQEGFELILSFGFHDTPEWIHENYMDTYYLDQFGKRYTGDTFLEDGTPIDNGDANLVFNEELRGLVGSYMKEIISEFGDDFYAIRLGGGRYGEVTYPPTYYEGRGNLYWAYDENARKSAAETGIAGWRPEDPSPDGEAGRFLEWYLDSLVEYQNWQISALRESYDGRIMMLYPSWGIRPGQIDEAVAGNLDGNTLAEKNGEIQRGFDFARQVGAIADPKVVVTTTWLDARPNPEADDRKDQRYWPPVEYLSSLAEDHPLRLELYGENTGWGSEEDMEFAASQMKRYGLRGMLWYREDQLFSGRVANLDDYKRVIRETQGE